MDLRFVICKKLCQCNLSKRKNGRAQKIKKCGRKFCFGFLPRRAGGGASRPRNGLRKTEKSSSGGQ